MSEETIVKIGYLNCDLWNLNHYRLRSLAFADSYLLSEEKVLLMKEEFDKGFEIIASKGTKFVCVVVEGDEFWDSEDGIHQNLESWWAKEFLENIQDV